MYTDFIIVGKGISIVKSGIYIVIFMLKRVGKRTFIN
jgi:hypothetical protein